MWGWNDNNMTLVGYVHSFKWTYSDLSGLVVDLVLHFRPLVVQCWMSLCALRVVGPGFACQLVDVPSSLGHALLVSPSVFIETIDILGTFENGHRSDGCWRPARYSVPHSVAVVICCGTWCWFEVSLGHDWFTFVLLFGYQLVAFVPFVLQLLTLFPFFRVVHFQVGGGHLCWRVDWLTVPCQPTRTVDL